MALLRLAIGGGSGEKVGRPWPAWRGKRNAAELRKGWLCSVHALRHTLRAHTSALISPVYARARTHSSKHSTRTRVRDGLNSSIGVALVRKERVWIGRAIRRDRRSANWLSPITFIHLKSTRLAPPPSLPPLPSLPLASFPPFFIPFRVHHAPATFTIAPRSNSTSRRPREQASKELDNSPPAERPFFERPCSLSLGRFLKIKSWGKPANGNHLSLVTGRWARPVKIRPPSIFEENI